MALMDTRLIQTAVLGSRDSDQPVICPEEAHNLDQFRLRFGTDRFWCGTLLDGCGEKLMTKRYEDKICHFAHYPDAHGARSCHRTANGEESADHLFIKRDVKAWLADQGHAAKAELRSLGQGSSDAVDFWLRATEQLLRFELRSQDYRTWRAAADSLAAKAGHVEWVFGTTGPLVNDMVARQGYALLVRCETLPTDRRVLIGVVTETRPVTWAPLAQCRMTIDGLVPPALEALHAEGAIRPPGNRNDPLPASLPLRGAEIVFAVDGSAAPAADSPLATPDRYLVSAFAKPAGSRILRACISLPNDVPAPTEEYVYRLAGVARLLITDSIEPPGTRWAIRADGLTRLKGLEAERTGLWQPSVSLAEQTKRKLSNPTASAASLGQPEPSLALLENRKPAPCPPAAPEAPPATVPKAIVKLVKPAAPIDPASVVRARALEDLMRQAQELLPRTKGRRAERLAKAIDQGARQIRKYRKAHAWGRTYLVTSDLLEELARVIGHPISAGKPAAVEARRRAKPVQPRTKDPSSAPTAEEALAQTRSILEELARAEDAVDTLELRSKLAHVKILRRRHRGALPDDVQTMFDTCGKRLEQRMKSPSPPAANVPAPRPEPTPPAAEKTVPPNEAESDGTPRMPTTELSMIATKLRSFLQEIARHQSTITWPEIRRRLSIDLPYLHPDDQGEVLVMVDRETPSAEPLLSALITVGDREIHPLYRHVAYSLGRELPLPKDGLQSQWQMDVLRLHALWRHR